MKALDWNFIHIVPILFVFFKIYVAELIKFALVKNRNLALIYKGSKIRNFLKLFKF
jgi:hypothetical protein